MTDIRIGQGFDVHQLTPDRKLILGGVEIPYNKGLIGHSDADALAHAVMNAILGALAMGDIGTHFPPSDPAHKDADSMKLLARVVEMARSKGWRVKQVDSTIIAQAPKLMPFSVKMRENLAKIMGAELDRVSVKAATTETMGFAGRGEGIAVSAVALLVPIE